MSTAGKVLTVLSVLMMAVWIVLISAVSQINSNGTQALAKLKAELEVVKADVAQAEQNALDLRDKINAEQVAKERDLRQVRIRLAIAERQLTSTRETLSRVQIQLEGYTKALTSAQGDLAARNEEKADLEKKKADEEALVNRVRGENAELLDQLTKLRTDFQQTLKANESEVAKLRKPAPSTKPAGRRASLIR